MIELKIKANIDELDNVLDFVNEQLEANDCSMKLQMQIAIAVEEIYVNVARYAYAPEDGDITVRFDVTDGVMTITFIDCGKPYNPLEKEDPDVTLSAEDRDIGGLGIYMVKKSMDDIEYSYKKDGAVNYNVLTIKKKIREE